MNFYNDPLFYTCAFRLLRTCGHGDWRGHGGDGGRHAGLGLGRRGYRVGPGRGCDGCRGHGGCGSVVVVGVFGINGFGL